MKQKLEYISWTLW